MLVQLVPSALCVCFSFVFFISERSDPWGAQVTFRTMEHLMAARRELLQHVRRNSGKSQAAAAYQQFVAPAQGPSKLANAKVRATELPESSRLQVSGPPPCRVACRFGSSRGRASLIAVDIKLNSMPCRASYLWAGCAGARAGTEGGRRGTPHPLLR